MTPRASTPRRTFIDLRMPALPRRRPRPKPRPLPTLVPVGGGPLRRLAWIFGIGR